MKGLKLFFKITGILLAALLLALAAFVFTFDANNYKPQIIEQVQKQTGRKLEISGDIGLSVFPWVGLKIGKVSLANAQGFSSRPFARMDQLDVKVKLLPLLKKQLEVDKVRLHGLYASLEVNAQGGNNWADLAQASAASGTEAQAPAAQAPPAEKGLPLAGLAINGIEFVDAHIVWDDAQNAVRSEITDLNLTTSAIRFDQPVDVNFSASVTHSKPVLKADITLSTRLSLNASFSRFDLKSMLLQVTADAKELLKDTLKLKLSSDITIDLDSQTAKLDQTRLEAMGLVVNANLAVKNLLGEPEMSGRIATDVFNARRLAEALGIELPPMADATRLTQLAFVTQLTASPKQATLNNIDFRLDDSHLTGEVRVPDIAAQSVRYKLKLSPIDADAYLPPPAPVAEIPPALPTAENTGITPAPAPDVEIALPLELIRGLDIQGTLELQSVTVQQIPITDIHIETVASKGVVRLRPISMKLLQGGMNIDATLNASGDTPAYKADIKAVDLQPGPVVNPMLAGLLGKEDVSLDGAAARFSLDISSSGNTLNGLKRAATGNLQFDMGKAELQGVDIEYFARNAVADYLVSKKLPVSDDKRGSYQPEQKTAFDRMHASANIAKGEVDNRDLVLEGKRLKVTGSGVVNLLRNDIDYNAVVDINPARLQTATEKLLDQPMPVHIHGPFAQLAFDVDKSQLANALSSQLKQEAQQKLDAEKAKLQQKIYEEKAQAQQKLDAEKAQQKQKLEDKLRNKLKGLF
jgi:AsmA protein